MHTIFDDTRIVESADIDEMGHVNNLAYLRWAVHAASRHSEANGWSMDRYRQLNAGWVVRSHTIHYRRPAFEGNSVVVRTWIGELGKASCRRVYAIDRTDGDQRIRLADAVTEWAFVDFDRQAPKRIPEEVMQAFLVVTDPEGSSP